MNRKRSQGRFVFGCVAPAVILVILFMFIPTVNVFRMSLFRMGGITNKKEFVGMQNFKTLLGDRNFLEAMQNSIVIIVMVTICTIFLAVLFAALLSRGNFKGKNIFRVIFYIPNILSIVVIAGIFGAIYDPSNGLLNTFLRAIHLDGLAHQWMGDPKIVLYSVIFALVWQAIGYYMVMYMASMAAIPEDLYEAASLDGSTEIQTFFKVTLDEYSNDFNFLYYQYDKFKLPVCTDYDKWRAEWKDRSIFELHVQTGLRSRRVWIWYGDWCCRIYLLICSGGNCESNYRQRSLRVLERGV